MSSESDPRPSIFTTAAEYAREHLNITKTLILAVLAVLVAISYISGAFDAGERAFLDACFRHRSPQFTSPKVVIVEINEDAIRSVGRWPWDREWHATLIQALKDMDARAISLDILFSEEASPRTDDLMAKVMEKSGDVYLPVAYEKIENNQAIGIMRSIPAFSHAAKAEGHIQIEPDPDGVLRSARLYVEEKGKRRWHLGFLLALDGWGLGIENIRLEKNGVTVPIPDNTPFFIPLTDDGKFIINWPARWNRSFRHVSYVDVIQSYSAKLKKEKPKIAPDTFKNAICLVGVTAAGLFDIHATPLEPAYPTVGVTAAILNSLSERSVLKPVGRGVNIFILLAFAVAILLITLRAKYFHSLILIGLLAMFYCTIAYLLFVYTQIVVSFIYPLIMILSGYAALVGYHQIVISIEKGRLLKLATTDPLTGLFNIGHFKRLMQAELQSTRLRAKKDICLVMADGDYFKKVNDTYGHAVGDEVLRGLAEVFRSNCRALDVAARYGGEEFIVMLPGATLDAGLKVAEKMRAGVQERVYNFGPTGSAVHFTASFGVVAFAPGESMDDFLKRADEALYLAKKTGRNCVCTV